MTEEVNNGGQEAAAQEEVKEISTSVALPSFYGVKEGMTRIFDDEGNHVPVTVIRLVPNVITQVKTAENDGYEAYQVGYYEKRPKLLNRPTKGHLSKAKVDKNLTRFAEIRIDGVDSSNVGKEVSLESFAPSTYIDVTGTSKGKGFQGVIKRYGFACGPMSHGSKFHRTGGSIGNRATPGRVWKNKKMPGHMGAKKRTVQNLQIVEINTEKGYALVRGAVPGAKNSFVKISKAVKK